MLGIGKSGEPYEGIGRGELNIEGMPVYRDAMGGISTSSINCMSIVLSFIFLLSSGLKEYRKFKESHTRPDRLVTSLFNSPDYIRKNVNPGELMYIP